MMLDVIECFLVFTRNNRVYFFVQLLYSLSSWTAFEYNNDYGEKQGKSSDPWSCGRRDKLNEKAGTQRTIYNKVTKSPILTIHLCLTGTASSVVV